MMVWARAPTGYVCRSNGGDGIDMTDKGRANSDIVVAGNRCHLNAGWGIDENNNATLNVFDGNHVRNNSAGGISLAGSNRSHVEGGWGHAIGTLGFYQVTAAGSLTIPPDAGELVRIQAGSATNIDTITPVWPGRRLTLWFNDARCTLRHKQGGTGQLFLSGGANVTPNMRDIIQLVGTGDAWLQASPRVDNG